MRRGISIAAGIIAAILVGAMGLFWYIGYLGGTVFEDMPGKGPPTPFAVVFLSGDMGFKMGMGPVVAHRLTADGVTVVGVNTLHFMRRTRSPAEIARLIAQAEARAMALAHVDRIVLIGQSFGADMAHVGLAGLAPSMKARIEKVVLIVPESTVEFRASPSEVLTWNEPETSAMPTARQLGSVPTLCVHGAKETISLCPLLRRQHGVTSVAVPGGHAMHGDEDVLYTAISRFLFA